MTAAQKKMQEECTKSLAALTEADVRSALCSMAEEHLTPSDLDTMNDVQL